MVQAVRIQYCEIEHRNNYRVMSLFRGVTRSLRIVRKGRMLTRSIGTLADANLTPSDIRALVMMARIASTSGALALGAGGAAVIVALALVQDQPIHTGLPAPFDTLPYIPRVGKWWGTQNQSEEADARKLRNYQSTYGVIEGMMRYQKDWLERSFKIDLSKRTG